MAAVLKPETFDKYGRKWPKVFTIAVLRRMTEEGFEKGRVPDAAVREKYAVTIDSTG